MNKAQNNLLLPDAARRQKRAVVNYIRTIRSRVRWGRRYAAKQRNLVHDDHIRAAAKWLCRAQDVGADDGIAYGARLGEGWIVDSYPETTGYIIPTFITLAEYLSDPDFKRRAIAAGDWEIAIQMQSGAVMAGTYSGDPTPAIFNTGQVLLGWSALYRATGEGRYLSAARRAAEWMMGVQEENGNWRSGNSMFANPNTTVYNVKAAWGLVEAGQAGGWDDATEAGIRNAEYCLSMQQANGWFANCCLDAPDRPLLHTIAYAMQGLLGIGEATGRNDFVTAAQTTAEGLCELMGSDGFLPGRINAQFHGTTSWACLTGIAQTSIVWSRLYELTRQDRFRAARERANEYLMARHHIEDADQSLVGGVFGSWPFWGAYGQNSVLNWAAKFLIDALVAEKR